MRSGRLVALIAAGLALMTLTEIHQSCSPKFIS
jgi:hypothetical protein